MIVKLSALVRHASGSRGAMNEPGLFSEVVLPTRNRIDNDHYAGIFSTKAKIFCFYARWYQLQINMQIYSQQLRTGRRMVSCCLN